MQKARPSARTARRPLLRLLATASAVASAAMVGSVVPASVAAADGPSGATVVGELVQAWPEDAHHDSAHPASAADHAAEGPLSWIRTAAGESVRVPTDDVEGVPVGSTVQVSVGGKVHDAAAADGYDPARAVTGAELVQLPAADPALPPAGLTNEVTVVMVAPAGVAGTGPSLAQMAAAVDGPVADFWREQSGDSIRLGVTATRDWTTTTADCSDPNKLWDEVAAKVGFTPGPKKHLLLGLSSAAVGCSWALAQVGSAVTSGGMLYVSQALPAAIAHELGHNFGLGHSSGMQCDGAVDTGTCQTAAYRDYYDVMGASWTQMGALTAAQTARLGLLPPAQQQSVSVLGGDVTVTLAPLSGGTGTRALRLTGAAGIDYWVEYRAAAGQDAWLGTPANSFGLDTGVLVHRGGDLPDTALLLDGTPSATAGWERDLQAALPLGSAVPVSGGTFTVVVESISAAGAVVHVTPHPPAPAPAPASPAPGAPGGVMSGRSSGAGAAAAPATEAAASPASSFWAPNAPSRIDRGTPSLASAVDTMSGGGFVVVLAGVMLAASALLVVRIARRSWARRS
jgi:hypothetical protein